MWFWSEKLSLNCTKLQFFFSLDQAWCFPWFRNLPITLKRDFSPCVHYYTECFPSTQLSMKRLGYSSLWTDNVIYNDFLWLLLLVESVNTFSTSLQFSHWLYRARHGHNITFLNHFLWSCVVKFMLKLQFLTFLSHINRNKYFYISLSNVK